MFVGEDPLQIRLSHKPTIYHVKYSDVGRLWWESQHKHYTEIMYNEHIHISKLNSFAAVTMHSNKLRNNIQSPKIHAEQNVQC